MGNRFFCSPYISMVALVVIVAQMPVFVKSQLPPNNTN